MKKKLKKLKAIVLPVGKGKSDIKAWPKKQYPTKTISMAATLLAEEVP